jgi:isochorismate synthase
VIEPDQQYSAVCFLPSVDGNRKSFGFRYDTALGFVDGHGNRLRIEAFNGRTSSPQHETSRSTHAAAISQALAMMQKGVLSKVIVSRIKHVGRQPSDDLDSFIQQLCLAYPGAFIYRLNHPQWGEWIGATPEVLLRKAGREYQTMSLAGTLATGSNETWNKKLVDEQAMVTSYIEQIIDSFSPMSKSVIGPEDLVAGPVRHLCTYFKFNTEKETKAVLEALHPTPAICGLPKDSALNFISQNEAHERRLYTGYLGVETPDADAMFWVNLRCMQIFDDHYELHIGGGITALSVADEEWEETERKSRVLLNFLRK